MTSPAAFSSNIGASTAGVVSLGVELSIIVESPSNDPAAFPCAVNPDAAAGYWSHHHLHHLDIQPRGLDCYTSNIICCSDKGCHPVVVGILDNVNSSHDALHHLGGLVSTILLCTLCDIDHMACLCLHHITNNASRVPGHQKGLCATAMMKK